MSEELNIHQEQAQERLEKILYSEARVKRKLADPECPPSKKAGLQKRLDQFENSKQCLAVTIKTGVPVRLKDAAQRELIAKLVGVVPVPSAGVVVDVPAGSINVEGK